MAVKTFTTGEVLTASDTNTYLANSGLVYITSTTIGSAVSSVTVSNVFSSTYDTYRIIIFGNDCSATGNLLFQLSGATGNTYYTNLMYMAWGGATLTGYGPAASNKALVAQMYISTPFEVVMDVLNPNKATRTYSNYQEISGNNSGVGQWQETGTTQHTGFTVNPDTGTMTGGTIRVYGYRQA